MPFNHSLVIRALCAAALCAGLIASTARAQELTVAAAGAKLRSGDAAGAAAILEQVTAREPDNARAWQLLGFAYHRLGDYEKAIPADRRAAEFEETASTGMYNLACALARTGRSDEAFDWLFRLKAAGATNLSDVAFDTDLESLADDPRFQELYPTPAQFADPFVERVRVLRVWDGEAQGDSFGWIARRIGDVDGDGVFDFTTSAPEALDAAGTVYVYSGRSGDLVWKRSGEPGWRLGLGIEAAGDVNADGIPDVAAGAPGGGKTFFLSGRDGAILRTLLADAPDEAFGRRVAGVGDYDGDGHGDVLVGAPDSGARGAKAGRAAVYSGRTGAKLVEFFGAAPGAGLGNALAGRCDAARRILVVGAPGEGPEGRGRVRVYYGRATTPAFVIDASPTGARMGGMFVSVVGDVNGDGDPDIYASDWADAAKGPSTGRIVVHSGRDGRRLLDRTGSFAGDGFGIGPADAGDVDGDGCDDLVIGSWRDAAAAPAAGRAIVVSGRDGDTLRIITDKVPGDTFGFDATGLGDVDGDGEIDFLITAAWSALHGSRTGRVFLIAGVEGGGNLGLHE